jgi:hypothetical protein
VASAHTRTLAAADPRELLRRRAHAQSLSAAVDRLMAGRALSQQWRICALLPDPLRLADLRPLPEEARGRDGGPGHN